MNIVNLYEIEGENKFSFGPRFTGEDCEISSRFGAENLGFHLEIMDPKTFSSPYHYHEKIEELCFVIEGEAIVRRQDKFQKVKPGDLIFYEKGPESVHQMYNHTEKPFKYLVLSSKASDDVCFYPDSRKKLDYTTRKVTQEGVEVEYWKDEMDPGIYWPEDKLVNA